MKTPELKTSHPELATLEDFLLKDEACSVRMDPLLGGSIQADESIDPEKNLSSENKDDQQGDVDDAGLLLLQQDRFVRSSEAAEFLINPDSLDRFISSIDF